RPGEKGQGQREGRENKEGAEVRAVPQHQEEGGESVSRWYAAHIVMYVEFKEGEQKSYPVWENIVLVEGESEEVAFRKAEMRGRDQAGDDGGTFRWGGRPASWVFGGLRKLTLCENADERPG